MNTLMQLLLAFGGLSGMASAFSLARLGVSEGDRRMQVLANVIEARASMEGWASPETKRAMQRLVGESIELVPTAEAWRLWYRSRSDLSLGALGFLIAITSLLTLQVVPEWSPALLWVFMSALTVLYVASSIVFLEVGLRRRRWGKPLALLRDLDVHVNAGLECINAARTGSTSTGRTAR